MRQFYRWIKTAQPISDDEVEKITQSKIGMFHELIDKGHFRPNEDFVWHGDDGPEHEPVFWNEI